MIENIRIDHSALRTNQALIIGLSILAFLIDQWILVAVVALIMLLGVLLSQPGFGFVYKYVLKPQGWLKPDVIQDHPEPHRFAQFIGTIVLGLSILVYVLEFAAIAWILVWLVIALAALNLFAGFCVGCALYYWFARYHVPGFDKLPISKPATEKVMR